MSIQAMWQWCNKCQYLAFSGNASVGGCAAGSVHDHTGSGNYVLTQNAPAGVNQQANWQWCNKCQGLTFAGDASAGTCAAGGSHDHTGSGNYVLTQNAPAGVNQQANWRWCNKCQGLTFAGNASAGTCAAGGSHDHTGSGNYVINTADARQLDFDVNPVAFGNGVPVGGHTHLSLRSDGSYKFSGYFHDSGATEYNVALVWAVKDAANQVYTFQHAGHVAGTFEAGSRDDTWNSDGNSDAVAHNWMNIAAAASGQMRASANGDLVNLTNSLVGDIGLVVGVIGIVVAV